MNQVNWVPFLLGELGFKYGEWNVHIRKDKCIQCSSGPITLIFVSTSTVQFIVDTRNPVMAQAVLGLMKTIAKNIPFRDCRIKGGNIEVEMWAGDRLPVNEIAQLANRLRDDVAPLIAGFKDRLESDMAQLMQTYQSELRAKLADKLVDDVKGEV